MAAVHGATLIECGGWGKTGHRARAETPSRGDWTALWTPSLPRRCRAGSMSAVGCGRPQETQGTGRQASVRKYGMSAPEEILHIPGANGFQTWRTKGREEPLPDRTGRPKKADWIGIPARALVSIPMRFHGIDASRRDSAAQLELEGAGLGAEIQHTYLFQSRVYDEDARDQRAWTCVQAAPLPKEVLDAGLDAQFAPSVCFQNLQRGQAAVWKELGSLALVLPDAGGQPLHFQALTSREPDEDAAAEIRCILAAAELAGASPEIESVQLRLEADADGVSKEEQDRFAGALDIAVKVGKPEAPHRPEATWRLVPAPVVLRRQARSHRRMLALVTTATLLVICAGLAAFAAGLWRRQGALRAESTRLAAMEPKLEAIRAANTQWTNLELALTPQHYPVELFYQVVQLLPPEGIRLTLFEMNADKLTIAGEASSVNHAISFREDLAGAPAFKDWGFSASTPSVLPDGRATFQAEGTRPSLAAAP